MAPLDDVNGDAVLAEFEAIIRGAGNGQTGERPAAGSRGLVPERRAVNWVNALAAIAREIDERQGPARTEALLRTIGARMSRDLLTPLPTVRREFEPAINRTLSILDWGWVAALDRLDTIVFEHRAPWPFEKRGEHLRFVLEGFYTEILRRLSNDKAMHVRLSGHRGGAMVLKWQPVQPEATTSAAPAATAAVAPTSLPQSRPAEQPVAVPATTQPALVAEAPLVAPEPKRGAKDRRLPPLAEAAEPTRPAKTPRKEVAPSPVTAARAPRRSASLAPLLVAATVFIALFALGMMTSTGDAVGGLLRRVTHLASDRVADAQLYALESRARGGDADAQIRLGLQLARGGTDYAGAVHWFQAAAKSGSAEARYDLAVMTAEGLGVKRDPVGATILFMDAATAGFALAEYRLGAAYEKGLGVKRDVPDAFMWYERAARHGIREAQVALAGLYAAGEGIKADPVTAFAWYRVAEEQGDRAAAAKRAVLFNAMTGDQRTAAQAQSAALIGDINGARALTPAPAHPTVDRLMAQLS